MSTITNTFFVSGAEDNAKQDHYNNSKNLPNIGDAKE